MRVLGFVALLLTEVPNPENLLSFQCVYLQWTQIFGTRHCFSVNSACAVAPQYRHFRTVLWNYDQTWSLDMVLIWYFTLQSEDYSVMEWIYEHKWRAFCKEITNCPHCICLGYHRLRQWLPQIQHFPRVGSISSTLPAPSTLTIGTEKIPKKLIPSPSFTRLIQWYVTRDIFKSYTEGTIMSLAKFSTKTSRSCMMWYWRTRLWTLRFEV
jgi:hypothetical protein